MSNYQTPGVYVEEVATGARPIGMVGTSTAAFLGVAPKSSAFVGEPRPCMNWSQFVTDYVGEDAVSNDLVKGVAGFFENGGSRCFIVNIGDADAIDDGLTALNAIDEVAIVAAPGRSDPGSYQALLAHAENLGDRIAILDFPSGVSSIEDLKTVGTTTEGGGSGLRPPSSDGGYGAVYYPHFSVRDPLDRSKTVMAPPSGFIAGIYARTDAQRGVHKAPANEAVRGVLGLERLVTRDEQGTLNRAGVNVIRFFPSSGIRVWGARTLADEASEWRYVNIRRLVNMIKESIEDGTRWTVFEPNELTLWKSVERNVKAFLTNLWRQGALMGETVDQAFFVRCDAETNPQESIDAGQLVTVIGIAPVKPAEFIIFKIGMQSAEND